MNLMMFLLKKQRRNGKIKRYKKRSLTKNNLFTHYENFSYEKNQTKLRIMLYQIGIDNIKRWLKKEIA